jgi:hypothetical protein
MSEIKKKDSELPDTNIYKKIDEEYTIKKGDIFVNRDGEEIYRIVEVKESTYDGKNYFNYEKEFLACVDPIKWVPCSSSSSKSDLESFYRKVDNAIFMEGHELYKKYVESGYDLSAFNPDESIDDSTAIVAIGSKEYLEQMQQTAVIQAQRVQSIRMFVTSQMHIAKNQAEALRRALEGKLAIFQKQIKKIYKVIQTIELYLGISEELVQIQEGMPASADEPISFRQAILFMDEEVAVWENGGLDFSNIEAFENWLITDKNYEKCLPEQKGMVVFKPRRLYKKYSDDRITDAIMNAWNRQTYFLIRNGENVYRINSDNIAISKRLFPQREELISMLNTVDEEKYESNKEKAKEKFDDVFDQYRCMAFLMQGLIDRTEIFNPLPFKINIFNLEEAQDAVQFIYDDELALPSGKLPFWEWHAAINKQIKEGSRILHTGYYGGSSGYVSRSDYADRLVKEYGKYSVPPLPTQDIYEVHLRYSTQTKELPHYEIERLTALGLVNQVYPQRLERFCEGYGTHFSNIKPEEGYEIKTFVGHNNNIYVEGYRCNYQKEELYIKYNPKDPVSHGWDDYKSRKRKNNLSWMIYRDDDFILNYDHISIEDIDFYIHSRTDRKSYHSLMPLLKTIKAKLLAEMENEKNFIKFLVGRIMSKLPNVSELNAEQFVDELIVWWKFKTKQKRPISKDDTLAMRMIERRLNAAVNRKKLVNKD